MGNANSAETNQDDGDDMMDPFDGIDTVGYRVLGVQPNSPASHAGLVSFLDFLVGANGQMLLGSGQELMPGEEYDDVDLPALLNENKGKEIEFLVFNIKSQQARLVALTPDDTWGGAGLLGVTIRLDNYAGAEDRLVRILTVQPQSPAAVCGLVPYRDFLLGTTHQTLDSTRALSEVLQAYRDQIVELYVYNCDSDKVRVVALMPTLDWGGNGLLGAEVGTGYLHRLPSATRSTEGTSVERKVRYVNGGNKPAFSSRPDGTGGSTPNATTAASQSPAFLEVEPQLEMEVEAEEDGDDDDDAVEDVTLQAKTTLNKQSTAESSSAGDAPPTTPPSSTTTTQTTATATTEVRQSASESAGEEEKQAPRNEAAALFQSTPPPQVTGAPYNFMPPPPKMHT